MIITEEISHVTLLKLSERLQLTFVNKLYVGARNPIWMSVVGGEETVLWMRSFDYLRLSVSGIAEDTPLTQRVPIKLMRLHRRPTNHVTLQAVLSEAEAVGLHPYATIGRRSVLGLPVSHE